MDSGEPYSSTAPRPAGSTVTMKAFLGLITAFVIAQLIGTALLGLYLYMKVDKLGDEITLQDDFVFLRRLQKCRKPQDADATLLDCAKILGSFQDLLQVQTNKVPLESLPAKQTGDKRQAASIHLAGLKDSKRVLQWNKAVYAPMDDVFSYQDGKLKVAKGGRYYIYSQVAFCAKPELHVPFSLYVYLHLPSESDRLLLKGVGTHGPSDDLCGLQSIHLGRAAELQEGHVIFVNVTDSSRVNYDHGNTYFGMFELS
ncbi:CD40 ligand [Rhineura floridana]|uniref:CD40 ligand n=1 Tax=Rhineura floridana TaxID=261503 RepID=UPI002AC87A4E|nr:CD40 ligand [Rhineura floridana]